MPLVEVEGRVRVWLFALICRLHIRSDAGQTCSLTAESEAHSLHTERVARVSGSVMGQG